MKTDNANNAEPVTPVTPVIFRSFPDHEGGEVIALFPYDQEFDMCVYPSSYMHMGQHGAATHDLVYVTRLATPSQYADLKLELETIGYRLRVIKRWPTHRQVSKAQWKESRA